MEKFLKRFNVGNSQITLGGYVATEDDRGKQTHYYVGLEWEPWKSETGKTVVVKNHMSIEGDPGSKVSISVFAAPLKDRKVLEELRPTFSNENKRIWIWEYDQPFVVFIEGERDAENWTVSYWRMFSGHVVFDLAKNRLRFDDAVNQQPGNGDGHGEEPQIADLDPGDIAGKQLLDNRKQKGVFHA